MTLTNVFLTPFLLKVLAHKNFNINKWQYFIISKWHIFKTPSHGKRSISVISQNYDRIGV